MVDFIVIAVILAIVGGASAYILNAKKKGVKCIGCSSAASCEKGSGCSGSCAGCNGSCCHTKE